jgi:hypothetical protein
MYDGATMTIAGNLYKVRLMRGFGQAGSNEDGTGTPNYVTGPLFSPANDGGTNWPNTDSP